MFERLTHLMKAGGPCAWSIAVCGVAIYALLLLRVLPRRADAQHSTSLIRALIAIAPLLGLLGTVSGMVRTFEGLNARGQALLESSVGAGLSEALLTTQLGLAVAVPAMVFERLLARSSGRRRAEPEAGQCR